MFKENNLAASQKIPYADDSLLTLADILYGKEKILPVSRSYFYNCVAEGMIPPPLKFGRKSMWKYGDIRAFIRSRSPIETI